MEGRTVTASEDGWSVAGRTFRSRLIIGTGKYRDYQENADALKASGAEIVTVAVRRVNLSNPNEPMLVDFGRHLFDVFGKHVCGP